MTAYPLAEDALHIWHARLDGRERWLRRYRAVLAQCELNRASRFHSLLHQQRYIIAHGVLRYVLCQYTGRNPADISIFHSDFKKPTLTDASLEFSLSHSNDIVVIAIARRQVGIDVERVRPLPDAMPLAKRYFSEFETISLSHVPEQFRNVEFLRLWTRKEAFLKGCGLGLQVSLPDICVLEDEVRSNPITAREGEIPVFWRLREFRLHSGYLGCVAVHSGFSRMETFCWEL